MSNIRLSKEATQFFEARKPGFIEFGDLIAGIKCFRMGTTLEEQNTNFWDESSQKMHMFSNRNPSTERKIETTTERRVPIRVCLKRGGDYLDMGWGVFEAEKDDQQRYVIDVSDRVQVEFALRPYPNLALPEERLSILTEYKGFTFDSELESKHARFFDLLGIKYTPYPASFPTRYGTYTPDFEIQLPYNCPPLLVEIKPFYPYVEEEERCHSVAFLGRDIVLLYGMMTCPFGTKEEKAKQLPYTHKNGVRGLYYSHAGNGKIEVKHVVWKVDQVPHLGEYGGPMDYGWSHKSLLDAYTKAASLCPPPSSPPPKEEDASLSPSRSSPRKSSFPLTGLNLSYSTSL